MKLVTLCLSLILTMASVSVAAIVVPGADGSDGALVVTEDMVIDLSQAVDGDGTTVKWDTNNAANAGKGIYDPEKWAVVFKYTSVTVAADATVTFKNHASRAPVVWLVSGDVTIDGTVSLNGQSGRAAPLLAEPGPGGFRGAQGDFSVGVNDGAGFGPGGGQRQARGAHYGAGDSAYGNAALVPLVGGSGGSGSHHDDRDSHLGGGAGGGAILIASSGRTEVGGVIRANGGAGRDVWFGQLSGGGSGGGVRIISTTLAGTGAIQALGGVGGQNEAARFGRIRIERQVNDSSSAITPDPSVISLTDGATALLWPPSTAPQVKVVSIGGEAAPADPRAAFGASNPDVALPETSTTQVVLETTNVEQASQVKVRVTPRANADFTVVDAAVDTVVSTSPLVIRWTAEIPVGIGYSAVQARVIRP